MATQYCSFLKYKRNCNFKVKFQFLLYFKNVMDSVPIVFFFVTHNINSLIKILWSAIIIYYTTRFIKRLNKKVIIFVPVAPLALSFQPPDRQYKTVVYLPRMLPCVITTNTCRRFEYLSKGVCHTNCVTRRNQLDPLYLMTY